MKSKEWACPHCEKILEITGRGQKGGHARNCEKNPKKLEQDERARERFSKPKAIRVELEANCPKCGVQFVQSKTEAEIKRGEILKFCSRKCANSRVVSEEHRAKVSKTLSEGYESGRIEHPQAATIEFLFCPICGTEFQNRGERKKKTCSRKCGQVLSGPKISKALKGTGKIGGYKVKSGTSKFHGSWYRDVWMDSSWELELAKRLDDLEIVWERDATFFFSYADVEGNERKYYPDFYLPDIDTYLECKGYWTEKVRHKMKAVQERHQMKMIILESLKEIKEFKI